jgi:hypothetical protein
VPPVAATAAPLIADRAGSTPQMNCCWATPVFGPPVRWAELGRAIGAVKGTRVNSRTHYDDSIVSFVSSRPVEAASGIAAGISSVPSSPPGANSAPSTSPHTSALPSRSFAAVVADRSPPRTMAGSPSRPPSSTTPTGGAPQAPHPAVPGVGAQPPYAGPPGFQGGW